MNLKPFQNCLNMMVNRMELQSLTHNNKHGQKVLNLNGAIFNKRLSNLISRCF